MTESELRSKVVKQAQAWLGLKAADGSYNRIVDLYNNTKPLPRGYAVRKGGADAWCATFVSAVGIAVGMSDIMPRECSCPKMIELYKAHTKSRWEENDAYVPKPGDIILYDWQDSGVGDNAGQADHIGIVETVTGNAMTVIEGNMGNVVGRRHMAVNGQYIRGYCLPAYAALATDKNVGNKTGFWAGKEAPSEWAKPACEWAVTNKIFNGDGKGNYNWTDPITREAVAQILYNLYHK